MTTIEKTIQHMMTQVDEFQTQITGIPYRPGRFPEVSRYGHLAEELREIIASHIEGDIAGVVDGHVDLVYIALGNLLQMGISPQHPFDDVHRANMQKVGRKTERHDFDAVKPAGWEPPNFDNMLEHLEVLHNVSPIFVDITRLRMKKGNNYNRGNVKRSDHFPMGDLSFFQVIWMKMCRVRSMVENPGSTDEQKAESRRYVEREMNDILVYGTFWLEFMRGLEI